MSDSKDKSKNKEIKEKKRPTKEDIKGDKIEKHLDKDDKNP